MGIVYDTLAKIQDKDKTDNCTKAIQAYQEALKVYVLDNFPTDYAMTQYNMGIIYGTLAEIQNKANNCNMAIKAYQESLKVFTRKEFPEVYNRVEKNIKKCLLQNAK
jgi:tetratricopeptide (TPR) repeat protein